MIHSVSSTSNLSSQQRQDQLKQELALNKLVAERHIAFATLRNLERGTLGHAQKSGALIFSIEQEICELNLNIIKLTKLYTNAFGEHPPTIRLPVFAN